MAIRIEMLRCFSYVAQSGNLAEAATRLGRTQSAVSMSLKQLEDHLGQKLFVGERKNQLTSLGEQVFSLAQQQIQHFDATVREIQTSASTPRGLLRIASIPSAAGHLVPQTVEIIMARHRGLKVDIRDTDSAQVTETLIRGQADIGIASGISGLNGVHSETLFEDPFGLICAPDHPLAKSKGEIRLSDLGKAGFVGNNLCRSIGSESIDRIMTETNIHAHNTFSLFGMLRSGSRCTILPRKVVEDLGSGLVFRPISDLNSNRQVSILIPERSSRREIAKEFADVLRELVRQGRGV